MGSATRLGLPASPRQSIRDRRSHQSVGRPQFQMASGIGDLVLGPATRTFGFPNQPDDPQPKLGALMNQSNGLGRQLSGADDDDVAKVVAPASNASKGQSKHGSEQGYPEK